MNNIKTNWNKILEKFDNENNISKRVDLEYNTKIIFPKKDDIYKAFSFFDIEETKLVILGQDPYHNDGEAMGLSFSVPKNIKTPSSLRNIFKELKSDLGIERSNPDLTDWAKQGVLLLNVYLMVEKNKPLSYKDFGWDILAKLVIEELNKYDNVVYLLMGNFAKQYKSIIKNKQNIIETTHPSGLSAYRGFFDSKPFSKINELLEKNKVNKIKW